MSTRVAVHRDRPGDRCCHRPVHEVNDGKPERTENQGDEGHACHPARRHGRPRLTLQLRQVRGDALCRVECRFQRWLLVGHRSDFRIRAAPRPDRHHDRLGEVLTGGSMNPKWFPWLCGGCFLAGAFLGAVSLMLLRPTRIETVWPTQYPAKAPCGEAAIRTIGEQPPDTEADYRKKYGEAPWRLLYHRGEKRFYTYVDGKVHHWIPTKKDGYDPRWLAGTPSTWTPSRWNH